jgi:hypothetical protein
VKEKQELEAERDAYRKWEADADRRREADADRKRKVVAGSEEKKAAFFSAAAVLRAEKLKAEKATNKREAAINIIKSFVEKYGAIMI